MFANVSDFAASRAMYAGMGRDILRDGCGLTASKHVRAHADTNNIVQNARHARFNVAADHAAKAAANKNKTEDAVVGQYDADVKQFCRAVANILTQLPNGLDTYGKLSSRGRHT